jgi:hypothetical protein
MELAKTHELRWASGGIGTSEYLAGEFFTQMLDLKMIHVGYPAIPRSSPNRTGRRSTTTAVSRRPFCRWWNKWPS